jgi:hypothetical protein
MTAIARLVSTLESFVEPDRRRGLDIESVENLRHGRAGHEPRKFRPEELLKRLARSLGAAKEFTVHVIRHVSD